MAGPTPSVEQCLSAAHAGSREALGQALQACRPYLLRVAQQEMDPRLQAQFGASDVVQETFRDAQRLFERFHGASEAELLSWLRQLLLYNVADAARRLNTGKRQVQREVPLPGDASSVRDGGLSADGPSPSSAAGAAEQGAALERALGRLPEEYRRVLALRYQDDLPFDEIGRRMDRSANAARKLWLRAVQRLRQEMDAPP
jgi:RNA polymerase sigma-70 factor (ECF subfamily)